VDILSICSGVGGLDLGVKLAVPSARTVCYVENEAYCCEVLVRRMEEKCLDEAPVWTDIKTFDGKPWRGKVDCIIGGYPCQPFSVAGKRTGTDDPRHLWPYIANILVETEATLGFFENVPGHLNRGFREVVGQLETMDYKVATGLFSTREVGGPHLRKRLFFLAHTKRNRLLALQQENKRTETCRREQTEWSKDWILPKVASSCATIFRQRWDNKPNPPRVVDGDSNWVERLRACGNGVVPVVAAYAFASLWKSIVKGR